MKTWLIRKIKKNHGYKYKEISEHKKEPIYTSRHLSIKENVILGISPQYDSYKATEKDLPVQFHEEAKQVFIWDENMKLIKDKDFELIARRMNEKCR